MQHRGTTVRVGPVSVIVLVVVICLAVLSVLAIATAQASMAEAKSQAEFATATYENDTEASCVLARVDASLARSRDEGLSPEVAAIRATREADLPQDAQVEGTEVSMKFTAGNGRTLSVRLEVTEDLTYRVVRWSTGVDREESAEQTELWAGV